MYNNKLNILSSQHYSKTLLPVWATSMFRVLAAAAFVVWALRNSSVVGTTTVASVLAPTTYEIKNNNNYKLSNLIDLRRTKLSKGLVTFKMRSFSRFAVIRAAAKGVQ